MQSYKNKIHFKKIAKLVLKLIKHDKLLKCKNFKYCHECKKIKFYHDKNIYSNFRSNKICYKCKSKNDKDLNRIKKQLR